MIKPISRIGPKRVLRNALLAAVMLLFAVGGSAGASVSDFTIEIDGDLLEHGGVVIVYPIPTSAEAWAEMGVEEATAVVRIVDRYAVVQLRYPEAGKYTYRFRPVEGRPDAEAHWIQVLSIIGTNMEDRGPQMTAGFQDAYSSGGRIIRVPPMAELAGKDEATRTMARWGETERHDAVPPADQRSARSLLAVIEHGPEQIALQCSGDARVQVCAIAKERWSALEARWWRSIAEARLERLRHHALRRCYDSNWFGGGTCKPDPDSDEPAYQYRN